MPALLVLLGCLPDRLAAQSDTSRLLPTVLVRDASLEKTGFSTWKADSLPVVTTLSLSERLALENPLAVRANAPGTLATLSARGLGPSHTPVFWQGFNLQSPQNGVVDAALIPVWPGDEIQLRYGGQSAALSSGAMGGAVMVESAGRRSADPEGFFGAAGAVAGSFGRIESQAALGWANERFSTETRAAWQRVDNDFPFQNFTQIGSPRVRQSNNALKKVDLQHFDRWEIDEKNLLKCSIWQQLAFREIPPAMTEAPARTWQRDQAFRAVASWVNDPGPRKRWEHRVAWFDEAIFFRLAGDTDSSRARTAAFSSDYTFAPAGHWILKGGVAGTLQWGRADGYTDTTRWYRQERLAVYGMAERRFERGRLSMLLRQEWTGSAVAPITWSVGGTFGPLRFHMSRNFLLPTINDRFWRTLGQPDLRAESGYSADIGCFFRKKMTAAQELSGEATVFNALTNNWILWQPGADGIFRPSNARRVWSRGIEMALGWEQQINDWNLAVKARWQYTLSTNTAVYAGEKGVLHKQLPYVPKNIASASLRLAKGAFSAAYLHQWTGARFTTTDNLGAVPAYQTGTLMGSYRVRLFEKTSLAFDFRLENCWNSAYQVIAYRPMPGRNWRLGLQWIF